MPTSNPLLSARSNRLIKEKSPYLQQHAHNPVDWYPWGEEAFEKARNENRPIFLSIGYSTCHWCHVMERESFEDTEVARRMNEAFVCVKVDREERPDIDADYMTVCQMMTGSGGWPLTIVMTPDKQPFFAATYVPKETRFGRIGMLELIPRLRELWSARRDEVLQSANQITDALQRVASPSAALGDVDLDRAVMTTAFDQLAQRFDEQHGGFGGAPKFPMPHSLFFLLRYWKRSGNGKALSMVEKTLQSLRLGGVFDHIGFGFHRYATDRQWLVPHFEKMLYDQGLLAVAYAEAFQATGNDFYAQTAREILTYVLRDMTSPEGAFYSAEDADSEGQEGKFYLWTEEEIEQLLAAEDAAFARRLFHVTCQGNFLEEATRARTGRNILHLTLPLTRELSQRWEPIREYLFAAREQRVRPERDEKILTDWNGLMIAALARAGQVLVEAAYTQAASRAARFILTAMRDADGRLAHRYGRGERGIPGFLEDYAFLAWGLLELYQATLDESHLRAALELNEVMCHHFWDERHGGLHLTADDSEFVLARHKPIYDGALPSGNSVALFNLLCLARMTGNPLFEEKAARLTRNFAPAVREQPLGHTHFLAAFDVALGPSYEVVVIGQLEAEETQSMLRALRKPFIPNKVVLFRPNQPDAGITQLAEFTREMRSLDGRATAYVCQNGHCQRPTTDVNLMLRQLTQR